MDMPSRHDHAGHMHPQAHHHPPEAPESDSLKDPVCGMAVTARSEHHVEHAGRPYYFCSAKCLTKFVAEPARYAGDAVVPAAALTAADQPPAATGTIYTCPMHPEIRQDHPGNCPKCGMTLEPVLPSLDDDESPELVDFSHRFWWTLPFTAAVTVLAMAGHWLGWFDPRTQTWIELVLSLPVALWAGWPFYVRGVLSVIRRSPNMWTLIGLGTSVAFVYSVFATCLLYTSPSPRDRTRSRMPSSA